MSGARDMRQRCDTCDRMIMQNLVNSCGDCRIRESNKNENENEDEHEIVNEVVEDRSAVNGVEVIAQKFEELKIVKQNKRGVVTGA